MINAQENSGVSVYAVVVRWILTLWVIPVRRFVWTIVDRCVDMAVNVSRAIGRELHVQPVLAVIPRRQRMRVGVRASRPDGSGYRYTGGRVSGSHVRSRLG
jgi:regulation of enolase protein 1 (concanavalin A-like superfamily)